MAYSEIRAINNIQLEDIKARQSIQELDNKKANKSDIISGLNFKGTTTYSALPTSNNNIGDFYYVTDGDSTNGEGNYAWNGTAWYFSGKTTDFGDISTKANAAVNNAAFEEGKLKVTKNDGSSTETEVVDSSLTKSGKAADAKVTGEGLDTRMIAGIHTAYNPGAITDLDTFYTPGAQYINRTLVLQKQAELNISTERINNYYWSVINIAPISEAANNYDVIQFLIGTDPTRHNQFIYKRFSFARNWSKFERFGTDLEKIKTPQKVAFLGDSFTEHDSTISYVDYLGEMPEYEVTNLAEGGLTAGTWMDKYSNKITNDYDTYFIAFGLNTDTAGIGTPDSTDNATFYGGFNNLLNTIISTCPKARIIMWCMDAWMSKSRSDMELEIATKYGCEYYSMKADANIPLRIDGKFAGVMEGLSDSVIAAKTAVFARTAGNHHPNATAQYMLATYLKNII